MFPTTIARCIGSAVLLCSLALTSACVTVSVSDSEADDIEKVERARFQAWMQKDVAAMRKVVADDVIYCHSSAICQNKEELIAFVTGSANVYRAMDVIEMKTQAYGDTVVINGKLGMKVEEGGQLREFQGVYTDVYVKRDGRWQLVRWQSTRAP